jgi:hypothetical protein
MRAATDLAGPYDVFERPEPGSFSEASALLLGALAPGGGGHPKGAEPPGDPAPLDRLILALYGALYAPYDEPCPGDLTIFVTYEHPLEGSYARVVGVEFGAEGGGDALVFSEPRLPLTRLSCRTLRDLRGLHERIAAARRRPRGAGPPAPDRPAP